MAKICMPTRTSLMNPVIEALKALGGSGTTKEINGRASEIACLSDEQLEELHRPGAGTWLSCKY